MGLLTRIAPTPSGFLHRGNALSFLVTQGLAQRLGAHILLRVDDLDSERARPEYVRDIFATLRALGILWQMGPKSPEEFAMDWSQRYRIPLYEGMLQRLCAIGLVYACPCSRTRIEAMGGPAAPNHACRHQTAHSPDPSLPWRLRIPAGASVAFTDRYMGRVITDLIEAMPDPIVRRRGGIPAYQVASLADDVHFGCNVIVRGQDLLPSTAVQWFMAQQLGLSGFLGAIFLHHPLLPAPDGTKLSKSAGHGASHGIIQPEDIPALRAQAEEWLQALGVC